MNDDPHGLVSLAEVFGYGRRRLVVPNYQRSYSWERPQRDDLRRDIEVIASQPEGVRHFAGTLVLHESETDTDCYGIVDGQQRLTTLIILLSELLKTDDARAYRITPPGGGEPINPSIIFLGRGQATGNTVRAFELNADTDDFFQTEVMGQADRILDTETKAHRELLAARDEFRGWIAANEAGLGPAVLLDTVLKRLGFLLYIPARAQEVGLMFEVINNRGKKLSELEKVKNYLVYFGTKNEKSDLVRAVDRHWGEILGRLNAAGKTSNADEDAFLRSAWIVFADHRKAHSHHVYQNLKMQWPTTSPEAWGGLLDFVEFLRGAASTYSKLYTGQGVEPRERALLERISVQRHIASILPLVISVMDKVSDTDMRCRLLDLIERLNFRFYGLPVAKRADSGQGHLFWLARAFRTGWEGVTSPVLLEADLLRFVRCNAPDTKLVQALTLDRDESYDYYGWGSLKFLLAAYEEELWRRGGQTSPMTLTKTLAKRDPTKPNDFFHLEHVWAREEKTLPAPHDHYLKRRLGNFVLLEPSLNSWVSNDPVGKKLSMYESHERETRAKAKMLHGLRTLYDEALKEETARGWKRRTTGYWVNVLSRFMDKRETAMLNFALNRWRVNYDGHLVERVEIDSFREGNERYCVFPERDVTPAAMEDAQNEALMTSEPA